ncbi:MAG: hypothetical protein ABUL41_00525 [Chitinophagaceae bacterium]
MSFEKENFLRTRLVSYLQRLDPSTPPRWGKMSVQRMIEHLGGEAIRNANGRLKIEKIITPLENLKKMREFMMSDKPFKENTLNPLISEEPPLLRYKTIQAAIGALQQELIYFFEIFEKTPGLTTRNPFFGDLNFDQNVQLLHKHALHHLRQFGVEPSITV